LTPEEGVVFALTHCGHQTNEKRQTDVYVCRSIHTIKSVLAVIVTSHAY